VEWSTPSAHVQQVMRTYNRFTTSATFNYRCVRIITDSPHLSHSLVSLCMQAGEESSAAAATVHSMYTPQDNIPRNQVHPQNCSSQLDLDCLPLQHETEMNSARTCHTT
jgi:hypothetical protein